MQSDPTYDFQINQFDRRWTTGGRYNRTVIQTMSLELNVGGDFRYDDIGNVGVDHWNQGQFVENIDMGSPEVIITHAVDVIGFVDAKRG